MPIGTCNDCHEQKEIDQEDQDGFCQDCKKKTSQDRIVQAIRNGFNLSFDRFAINFFDENWMVESVGYNQVENFDKIFEEIEKYIKNHPQELILGRLIFDNTLKKQEKGEEKRRWWSPYVPVSSRRVTSPTTVNVYYSPQGKPHLHQRVLLAQYRKIEKIEPDGSEAKFFIHPSALTEEQYERLKNALPDDKSCKIKGCGNNFSFNAADGFPGPGGQNGYNKVEDGLCEFHKLYPNYQDVRLGIGKDEEINNTRPRTQDWKIKIESILRDWSGGNYHTIKFPFPIRLTGYPNPFYSAIIISDSPLIADGNEIIIKNISFGPGEAEVDEYMREVRIRNFFGTIELVQPQQNQTPLTFLQTQQENKQIEAENDNLALLAFDLLEIIDKNNKLVQQAKTEKNLNLLALTEPDGSDLKLTDFENKPLALLDESQPLNSTTNQNTLSNNQKNKQRKENFANSLKDIFKKNQTEYQNQGNGSSSLENTKTSAIFQIESKQFDLKVLANGKYQNYRTVIEGFTKEEEIENYKNEVLAAIAQAQKEEKNDNSNRNNRPLINQDEKEIIKLLLTEAKEEAIKKFKSFLTKIGANENKMDFEILFNGTKTKYSNYPEVFRGLNDKREILKFFKFLKREVAKYVAENRLQKESGSPENSLLIPVLVCSFVALAFLVGLVLIVKGQKKANTERG